MRPFPQIKNMSRKSERHSYLSERCRLLLLPFLLVVPTLIRSWQLLNWQQPQEYIPPPPPSQLQEDVAHFIQTFQNVVQDKVNLQTASWYRHIGPFREELPMRADHPITSSAGNDDSIDGHETTSSNWRKFNASSSLKKKESSTTSNNDAFVDETRLALPDDFLWDKERDISGYFKQLYEACNQNADRDDRFTHSCFGFMQSLIHEPRCTVSRRTRIERSHLITCPYSLHFN